MSSYNRLRSSLAVACVTSLVACGSDNTVAPTPTVPSGIVVLDGYIQPGLTFLADTGTSSSKLNFGPSTEFDAGAFTLQNDTVLAVSSRGAGDLLYLADVNTRLLRKVQLPAGGNASSARLITGGNGSARVISALRDSQLVATVTIPSSGTPTITRITNAGTCPSDAFRFENATWVVDANAQCRTNYTSLGPVRLIRIPDQGTQRDTIVLSALRGSGASAHVINEVAYVSAGGEADFSGFPYTLVQSGAIARVDLRSRQVLQQKTMPTGSFGASLEVGLDGFFYVTMYENLETFTNRVIQLRANDLTVVGGSNGKDWRRFTRNGDEEVTCGSATADALGRVHCLVTGTGAATSLLVFSPAGNEVRRVSAGQGGVDLALRR